MNNNSYYYGLIAEKLALKYFTSLGFKLISQRYKTKFGEIDLILIRDDQLVFLEVKARKKSYSLETLLQEKQLKRNYLAAEFFLSEKPVYRQFQCRFDLLVILDQMVAEHLIDLIPPDLC